MTVTPNSETRALQLIEATADMTERFPPIGPTLRAVFIAAVVGVLAFSGWAYLLPMSGGVVAAGILSVEENRRSVASKNGGTIATLEVREGSEVKKGDVVVIFDRVQAEANFAIAESRYLAALARHARLRSELARHSEIVWPAELIDRIDEPLARQFVDIERDLFQSRLQYQSGRRDVLKSKLLEQRQTHKSASAEITGLEERLKLTRIEEQDVADLLTRGFERRPRLLALQRSSAELQSEINVLRSDLLRIRETEKGIRLALANLDYERVMGSASDLTATEAQLNDALEQRMTAASQLEDTAVRAPASGAVVDLQFFGPGGVVRPGEAIFDLLPTHDSLFVRARVRPVDIDKVHVNQSAQVRLVNLDQRLSKPMDAKVIHVSADRITTTDNQESFYEAFVKLDPAGRRQVGGQDLQAGMPVDVVLATEERTFVEYLISPVSRALFIGFREE